MSKVLPAVVALCALARPARAGCDEAEAEARTAKIRAVLDGEARRARRWNLGWGIGFGVAAAAQLGMSWADYSPLADPYTVDTDRGLQVSGAKAALASLSHVILPLKIVRPGPATGDACADLDAAERALRRTGRNERQSFWLNHLGALAFNVGGMLLLGMTFDTWHEAWMSVALGYPVALAHAYTQPRRGWHWARALPAVSVGVIRHEGVTGLAIGGAF